ncbi:MAG: galactose-1-phosphate uridylyltransferase [Bacillota bacterium]
MSELRWNPILRQWVVTASHRQSRTYKPPEEHCPLCPTKEGGFPTEIPAPHYEIAVFDNKFPSFRNAPEEPVVAGTPLMPVRPSLGRCEVVLYTDDHMSSLSRMPVERIRDLVDVWADRYGDLCAEQGIEYVMIFENRGDAVGVTLHHPHGQIYAFPFIPPIPMAELKRSSEHLTSTGRCLLCDVLAEEMADGRRVVYANQHFAAVVPFHARWPYEVHIIAREHVPSIAALPAEQRWELALALSAVARAYDSLFGFDLPYVMVMHQAPTDPAYLPVSHFHIEFYPPNRTADKLKYLAGCELGAGVFINDSHPEEKAAELRACVSKLEGQSCGPADGGGEVGS